MKSFKLCVQTNKTVVKIGFRCMIAKNFLNGLLCVERNFVQLNVVDYVGNILLPRPILDFTKRLKNLNRNAVPLKRAMHLTNDTLGDA